MINLGIIRDLCKQKDITLKILANDLNISQTGLSGMLKNNSTTLETLEKISKYFGVPVGIFFGEKTPKDANKVSAKIFKHYAETLLGIVHSYAYNNLFFQGKKPVSNLSELVKWIKAYKKQDTEFAYMSELIINKWQLTEEDFSDLLKAGVISKEQSILKLWARSGYNIKAFAYIYICITANKEAAKLIAEMGGSSMDAPQYIQDMLGKINDDADKDSEPHAQIIEEYTNKYDGEYIIPNNDWETIAANLV